MKFFILTDLEGTAGVYKWSQVGVETENISEYKQAKIWMTEEVNSCIEGILEVNKNSEIYVWDGHGHGGIDIDVLHKEVNLITRGLRCPYTFDQGYDALIMIAQHAMAGTCGACLCHTYTTQFYKFWLNGREIGEIGFRAYLAGHFDIPVILVTGDLAACNEAKSFIPDVETVCVKRAIAEEIVITKTPAKARELIKNGIKKALSRISEIKPTKIPPPYTFRARFLSTGITHYFSSLDSRIKKIDDYTIEIKGNDFLEVVKLFV